MQQYFKTPKFQLALIGLVRLYETCSQLLRFGKFRAGLIVCLWWRTHSLLLNKTKQKIILKENKKSRGAGREKAAPIHTNFHFFGNGKVALN